MLRTLLAERFELKARTESRERPIYALVLASSDGKPGPRLRKSDIDCGEVMRETISGRRPMVAATAPVCAHARYRRRLVASALTMPDLEAILTPLVGRTVVNRTGLGGSYDLELEAVEITPFEVVGPSNRPSDTEKSTFTTLPEQLGLELQATNGPVEVLVIDRAEKPGSAQSVH